MQFDYTAFELFSAYLAGQATLGQVLAHPAYQAVSRHARHFSGGITEDDIRAALHGAPSPFYGVEALPRNLGRIRGLIAAIRAAEGEWLAQAEDTLHSLVPGEDLNIIVYPILGYDLGIGLGGVACLNCNCDTYLNDPLEFLFYSLHECMHVLYERRHRVAPLSAVNSPAEWRSYYNLWTQNEGFAVYASLRLRQARGRLAERDYAVLQDAPELQRHRLAYLGAFARLQSDAALPREAYMEICFGPQRLTYRMGCELIRRIERAYGPGTVRDAFALEGDDFIARFGSLLAG